MYISYFKNTLLLKHATHHLSLQRVIIFLLVEAFALMLMAADWSGWWLLKVGVDMAFSEHKTAVKFASSIDSFLSRAISQKYVMLSVIILLRVELSKLESISQMLYQLS